MPRCPALTSKGTPCRNTPTIDSDYCQAHAPERAEARRRAASIAGRSKQGTELHAVKRQLRRLADDVLSGKVNTARGSVASTVLGTWLKAVEVEIREREITVKERELEEIKLKEFEEIRHELREVRELYEESSQQGKRGNPWVSWTN